MIQIVPVGSRWEVKVDFPDITYSWAQETHEFATIDEAFVYIHSVVSKRKWTLRVGRWAKFLDRFDRRF